MQLQKLVLRKSYTPLKFNISPLKSYLPNRKGSSSNQHFSRAMLNFRGVFLWALKLFKQAQKLERKKTWKIRLWSFFPTHLMAKKRWANLSCVYTLFFSHRKNPYGMKHSLCILESSHTLKPVMGGGLPCSQPSFVKDTSTTYIKGTIGAYASSLDLLRDGWGNWWPKTGWLGAGRCKMFYSKTRRWY